MTKFGESGKTRLSGLGYRSIQFSQVQRKIKRGDKFEDLKIQECLKHGKGK
jgi:hypothetical protein